jgi:uncharacterized protein (DUF1330 family)
MPAYVVIEVEVTDPAAYEDYRHRVPPTIERYGGRPLARGITEHLEGPGVETRMSIIEFADAEAAKQWYNSDEVRVLNAVRQKSSRSTAKILVSA